MLVKLTQEDNEREEDETAKLERKSFELKNQICSTTKANLRQNINQYFRSRS